MTAADLPGTGALPAAERRSASRAWRAMPFAVSAVALAIYASTASRAITWWDGSGYPLAAVTLGIPAAPGSLILTLLGWLVSGLPVIHPVAFRLALLAALISATLAGLVAWLGTRLATPEGAEPRMAEWLAGAFAGGVFALSVTPWTYATQFTPYGLSALWTALILAVALAWWRRPERSSGRAWLFLLFLLFGLDVSVHRTNLLLLPAALAWIGIRDPASGRPLGDAAAGVAGFALGLSFHLLLMPIAARGPAYMIEDPDTWAGWWAYVTVQQKGGHFLLDILPRRAPFTEVQLFDYVSWLARNTWPVLFVPLILAAAGWVVMFRDHPRRALGLLAFFLCASFGAVLYFNLPQHYFRSMDRHYLPSLVILAPWMAVGIPPLARYLEKRPRVPLKGRPIDLFVFVLVITVYAAWAANHGACDLSRRRFTETFARDLLGSLPRHAILLTNGDNDSNPLWYMQRVGHVRSDVTVVNLPLANTGPYVARLRRSDPDLARLLESERLGYVLAVRSADSSTVATVVEPRTGLGLPAGVSPPDSVVFRVGGMLLGQDRVALDILRLTRWKRPVCLAVTVAQDNLRWLWPYARLDGLAFRVIPTADPAVHDVEHLRRTLMERVSYAGLADTTVAMDADSRRMCGNYYASLGQLLTEQTKRHEYEDALATLRFMDAHVPPRRFGGDERQLDAMRTGLEAAVSGGASSAPH